MSKNNDRRKTENYINEKYCLANFVSILRDGSMLDDAGEKELYDIIFGGNKYVFPGCYDGKSDQFCLCSEREKYNVFQDLATRLVYVKETTAGGRSRSCPLNGNSFSALVGRLIAQYYTDGFKTYERLFDKLLSSKDNINLDAIASRLNQYTGLNLGDDIDDAKKLVIYMLSSFNPSNLITYDKTDEMYISSDSPLKIGSDGVNGVFWQIANIDRKEVYSVFFDNFIPSQAYSWVKANWPISECIGDGKYMVERDGTPENILNLPRLKVPEWFSLEKFVKKLIDLYRESITKQTEPEFPPAHVYDEEYKAFLDLLNKFSPERRKEMIREFIVKLAIEQSKMEKSSTIEDMPNNRDNDIVPSKGTVERDYTVKSPSVSHSTEENKNNLKGN